MVRTEWRPLSLRFHFSGNAITQRPDVASISVRISTCAARRSAVTTLDAQVEISQVHFGAPSATSTWTLPWA